LRIALVSTLCTSVPPVRSGSVELVVGLLASELTRRGHDVTVFAAGDSEPAGRLVSVVERGYHDDTSIWDWQLAELVQLGHVFERADEFDVISSHVYIYGLPFTRLVRTPTVHTFHISPTPDFVRFCRLYPEGEFVLVSEFQRTVFVDQPVAAVVPNGIDTGAFPFSEQGGEYLAYIGAFSPRKGTLEAIRAARQADIPIRLAGPDSEYFREAIGPELGPGVEYVGEVDHAGKVELLANALAMIFTPQWLEACPLVVLESMACGTPVLATANGPIPEIVAPPVGGLCVDEADLVPALDRVAGLDRRAVRAHAVEHFDMARMTDDYLRVFESVT
jgi:glycosyltransferase involved in cell wall biosynthesis